MSLSSTEFWVALAQIIGVNIVLSGDNAIVIALAARGLPGRQQSRAVAWGSGAAVVMRIVLTVVAVELLRLPWLKLIGAVMLLWIAVKLLLPGKEGSTEGAATTSLGAAIRTILVADLVMSLDNVIAVAAAAKGDLTLLVVGLAISIPLVVFASQVLLRVMERWPIIVSLGAALLGWVAGDMAMTDPAAKGWVAMQANLVQAAVSAAIPAIQHAIVPLLGAIGVIAVGKYWAARAETVAALQATGAHAPPSPDGMRRALLAVDGSRFALGAVRHLVERYRILHEPWPLQVHLVNVQRPVSADVVRFVPGATLDDYYLGRGEEALAPARALLKEAGINPREHRLVGNPGPTIAALAQSEGCDHIVMGARGLGTHTGARLGSVARATLEHAAVPVLLVKDDTQRTSGQNSPTEEPIHAACEVREVP
jgi:YjbE family integral membrane protein